MSGEDLFKVEKEYNCKKCKDKTFIIENAKVLKCTECNLGTKSVILDEDRVEELLDEIMPEDYKGIIFDKSLIKKDSRIPNDIKSNPSFDYYLDTIEKLYHLINTGEKINYSLLITAPQGMGKNSLVYSCMNSAIRNGKTVAPYMDSLELNNLLIGSDERYNYKDQDLLDKIITSDVCFIKIPETTFKSAIRSLKIVVDRRARRGLATIVTSRTNVNLIYKVDNNLESFIITNNFGKSASDFYRLRVVSSPYLKTHTYNNKYVKNSKTTGWS